MTKEAGFLETIVKDSKSISNSKTSSNHNEVKTEPSLFDSMLKDAKNSEEATLNKSNMTKEQTDSSDNVKKSIGNKTEVPPNQQNIPTPNENSVKTNSKEVSSFLNKVVQETAKSTQTQVQASNTPSLNNSNEAHNGMEKNVQGEIKTDKESVENKNETLKEASKTSLLDKLLQQANAQIQNESQTVTNTQNVTKENVPVSVNPNLVENVEPNIETPNQELNNSTKQQSNLTPPMQNSLEEVSSKNNTQQTVQTAPSLLDKLLQEANTQIQNEATKNTTPPVNNNETKVVKTTQIKEVENKVVTTSQEQQSIQVKEVITKELTLNNEKTTTIQTQVVKDNVSVTPKEVNEKVANELAKISQTQPPSQPEKLNLSKEDVVTLKENNDASSSKEAPKSLLDRLLDENKAKLAQENGINAKATADSTSGKLPAESLLNNIYLSSLNKASQNAFLEKTHEVKTLVANANTLKEVQKGADLLNLGLQNSEVVVEEQQFKENVKNEFLNKLSVSRDIIKHDITKMSEEIVSQSKTVKNEAMTAATNNLINTSKLPEIEITVSSTAAYNIENRIIGARQHMNSMMSDMARNMYLNYKPPVTAFRMNLNPGNLGSIAVLIKNDKESGLSISLNMSSVATLDSFVDNQAALRAALAKNFNTNTNINLEFNMQDGQQQGNKEQHNKKQQQNHQATNDILESLNNNSEANNKVTNYM